jgi:hypothetical protein
MRCAADGAVTDPDLGTSANRNARYLVLPDGLVVAQFQVAFGSGVSVGSGDCYVWRLPVPARRTWDEQIIGQGFPYHAVTGSAWEHACVATLADDWTSLAGQHDSWCQIISPYSMAFGTGTWTAATTNTTVTHNLGFAPAASDIEFIPTSGGGTNNATLPYIIDTITTTTFKVSTMGAINNTPSGTNMTYEWKVRSEPSASRAGSWLIGPTYPWAAGQNASFFFQLYYEPA